MAVPQVGGSVTQRFTTTDAAINISAIPNGSWMLLSVMTALTGATITPPTGWTTLHPGETTGTRRNYLYAKIKQPSDGATAHFTQSSPTAAGFALLWGAGAVDVALWGVGPTRVRSDSGEPAGARYTNTAAGISTVAENSLVVAISQEATNAVSQQFEVASVTPSGWTQQLWHGHTVAGADIETAWMATKAMPTPGATGDVMIRYVSPQDSNGWALQVAIPSEVSDSSLSPIVVGIPTEYSSGTAGISTGFSINRPSVATTGDYIVVALRSQSSVTAIDPSSPGFTRLGPAFVSSSAAHRVLGFYGRPITDIATEPAVYSFSVQAASNFRLLATAFVVRGVDFENPLAGFHDTYGGSAITNGRQVPGYTLTSSPALSLFMGASEFTATNDHAPTSLPADYTAISAQVTDTSLNLSRTYLWTGWKKAYYTVPNAGITWADGTGITVQGIALRGPGATPPPPEGDGVVVANGNGNETRLYYTTEDGPRTPAMVVPMRRGFNSVAEMLATPGFTWAHRGGSSSYPEHSMYAYTQSVARGYGVLEISLGRTSDGVWFGLHDQTTDRTSGGTFGNASSQTWAQIQAQHIVIGANGAPQPYMRWSELIEAYGTTHIIVADPKYAMAYQTEFLNMLTNDLDPERVIVKYSGSGSGAAALCTNAKARGFSTWGFFYAADASAALGGSGALQTWGPNWDLIGMDYTASQAVWDEALALGKPVIGHIAASQAAYNMAMAKGAVGVQVSGVASVSPVSWWT